MLSCPSLTICCAMKETLEPYSATKQSQLEKNLCHWNPPSLAVAHPRGKKNHLSGISTGSGSLSGPGKFWEVNTQLSKQLGDGSISLGKGDPSRESAMSFTQLQNLAFVVSLFLPSAILGCEFMFPKPFSLHSEQLPRCNWFILIHS